MHDSRYNPDARFAALAAARTTETGERLVLAADEFKEALCVFLDEWQAEYDDGLSMQLPDRFPGIVQFRLSSATIAARARHLNERRNLCHVLATERR